MRSFSFLLLAAPLLLAQDQPTRPRTANPERTTPNGSDGVLAGWLLVDSNNEVALAQVAEQKAQSNEVKQFARQMISDHGEMGQKLQRFAAQAGFTITPSSTTPTTPPTSGNDDLDRNAERGRRQGEIPEQGVRPRDMGIGTGPIDAQLIQELGQQCQQSARQELEQKSGTDFDRAYMTMMVAEHMRAKDMLTVFQRHVSGELRSALEEGQRTVETHLRHAQELCKQLERDSG